MNKLDNCPFCGNPNQEENCGKYEHEIEFDERYEFFYVACGFCEARSEGADNEEEAIKNWNNRSYKKL